MIDRIFCDVDGVLADFVGGVLKLFPDSSATHTDITEWNISNCLGVPNDEVWRRVNAEGIEFWGHLDPIPGALQFVRGLEEIAPVTFATTPSRQPHSAAGKLGWLQYHFGTKRTDGNVVLTSQKHLLARPDTALVDDKPENVGQFLEADDVCAVLFAQPWNGTITDFVSVENSQKRTLKVLDILATVEPAA
tara:strand:- start:220 stop:792 length:573 start_codon:yes stop_codon:yes gene_type:complete